MNDSDFDFKREVDAFLTAWKTASLATTDEHGRPHAANVQYAHDPSLRLYFISSPEAAHSRHVARSADVALTVYAHVNEWSDIHGVQLHGRCEVMPTGDLRDHAWRVFSTKYPQLAESDMILKRIEAEQFYRVTPTWMRLIDNRRGFGWKVERVLRVGD